MAQQNKWYSFFPNLLTTFNLLSGVTGIYFALNGNIKTAVILMFAGAFFDFFDGFAARWLNAYSATGEQLDSLADLLSFGMAPAVIVYALIEQSGIIINLPAYALSPVWIVVLLPLFAALRLARFNTDPEQKEGFKGVPVPATALFFAGLAISAAHTITYPETTSFIGRLAFNGWFMAAMVVFFAAFMVMPVKMFSLKMKSLNWKGNEIQYSFIIFSALLVVLFQLGALPVIIMGYVIMGLLMNIFGKKSSLENE